VVAIVDVVVVDEVGVAVILAMVVVVNVVIGPQRAERAFTQAINTKSTFA